MEPGTPNLEPDSSKGDAAYQRVEVDRAVLIRPACYGDADGIARIYSYYIENTAISFEEEPVDGEEIINRMGDLDGGWPWLVAVAPENDSGARGVVLGYAYAGQWSGRCAYRSSAEVSIYVAHGEVTRGVGTLLYSTLLEELRSAEIHTVIGGVALPNPASIALHERFGFEKVAHYKEVGMKFGRWIDVGYWQLMLDSAGVNVSDAAPKAISRTPDCTEK